jgi:hypothetical protein
MIIKCIILYNRRAKYIVYLIILYVIYRVSIKHGCNSLSEIQTEEFEDKG